LSMPPANPGGLTPVSYASIIAYWLSAGSHAAGNSALPGDVFQLRSITVEAAAEP